MKISFSMQDMVKSGMHFGHVREKYNPKMRPFIYALREGVHLIDLEKTAIFLSKALYYIADQKKQGKNVLFVSTKNNINNVVKKIAKEVSMPYICYRWPGGLLTNFNTIKKQIGKLKRLEKKVEGEGWEKLRKKEKLSINREIDKLNKTFEGIKDMIKLPDNVFIVDTVSEKIAFEEAKKVKIPIIALIDTNANPSGVNYPIPANDDAVKGVELILGEVKKALS